MGVIANDPVVYYNKHRETANNNKHHEAASDNERHQRKIYDVSTCNGMI